ncbi:MAG TPA: T9SS type A sorting domain-containing protein [Bacteroides sp.]|nr:T9SS type A sorting domain-containing protein [Bacteroides sp.]
MNLKVLRHIGLLLLLTTFSLNLYCQSDIEIVRDSIYSYGWDREANEWLIEYRDIFAYDSNGNRTVNARYIWDSETNNWVKDRHTITTYYTDGDRTVNATYKWDSETNNWIGTYRYYTTYDTIGNTTERSQDDWDSETNGWVSHSRFVISYSASGNLTGEIDYIWDSETKKWVGDFNWNLSYDINENLIEEAVKLWDLKTDDWVNNRREVFVYDANGNRTERLMQEWDSLSIEWKPYRRTVYHYDTNENPTEEIRYLWDSETIEWMNRTRLVYSNDINGNRIMYIIYEWDSDTNTWIEDYRHVYAYDVNGNLTEDILYQWGTEPGEWRYPHRKVYTYNNKGSLTEEIEYNWDPETNVWVEDYRNVMAYDSNGNRTASAEYDWNPETNLWIGGYHSYSSEYDSNGNPTNGINYYWDSGNNEWINRLKYVSYWSELTPSSLSQTFAPAGSQWYYDEGFAFSGDINYLKFQSEKDTLFMGRNCQMLVKEKKLLCNNRPSIEFLYTSDDTVYFYDEDFNAFQVLYIFSAKKDDYWSIRILDEENRIDTLVIKVDSTYRSNINGFDLRTLDVTYEKKAEGHYSYAYHSKIIERIGDVSYMFNWYPWNSIACDMNFTSGLRCYQDEDIGLYSTGLRESCDQIMIPYEPLAAYSPSWNVVKGNLGGSGTDSMVLEGREKIDGKWYKIINYYDLPSKIKLDIVGYLREDVYAGKAWYMANVDPVEKLIMDLSLEVGDSFFVEGIWNSYKDYRLVDSVWKERGRKHVQIDAQINPNFGGLDNGKLTFIEGVGTNIGIGYKVFNYTDNFPYLLCSYYFDTKIYQNDHPEYHSICILSTTSIDQYSDIPNTTIYPNPTTGVVTLNLNDPHQYRYQIIDPLGRSIESGVLHDSQIDLSGHPDGIYVITLWSESDRRTQQKFRVIKY